VNKIGHHVQTDFAIVAGWDLCVVNRVMPKAFVGEGYQIHMSLMLNYLDKLSPGYFNCSKE